MKKVYFAHPLFTYLTADESIAYQILEETKRDKDTKIICPRRDLMEVFSSKQITHLVGSEIMRRCLEYVKHKADAVVVLSIRGLIPKGCYDEVMEAFAAGKPVYCLDKEQGNNFHFYGRISSEMVYVNSEMVYVNNDKDWKYTYGKINLQSKQVKKKKKLKYGALENSVLLTY